jgi:uncharacterized membrane protein YraQ (UPF0718 family)
MSVETYIIYGLTIILVIISYIKNKKKTINGIKKGIKTFLKVLPILLPLFLIVGILLAVITPEFVYNILGENSGILGYVLGMTIGSITFMSPFVAYPLGAELLANGAAHPQIAGFLVTLMSVGIIYYPMESKFFNKKAAIYRNIVALLGAIIVVLVVLVIHSW